MDWETRQSLKRIGEFFEELSTWAIANKVNAALSAFTENQRAQTKYYEKATEKLSK